MQELVIQEKIENLIYEVRGKQVMLDRDLARLYECTNGTKDINKAVKRNIDRFPEGFMFQLTEEEFNILRFHFGTSKVQGGRRYKPYVFTEQGVAMLSSVLHSKTAIQVSIKIMNVFVAMRKYISSNLIEQKYINELVLEDHDKIKVLENSFQKLEEKKKVNEIYFDGQIYDMISALVVFVKPINVCSCIFNLSYKLIISLSSCSFCKLLFFIFLIIVIINWLRFS